MKMKIKMTLAAAITTASSLMMNVAHAAAVFESFANYATAGASEITSICSTCTGYGGVAGSFTLASAQTLNKAFLLLQNGFLTTNMQIFIFADGGSDLPAINGSNQTLPPIFFQDYTVFSSLTAEPGNTTLAELSLPNWNIDAGKYWIAFQAYDSTTIPFFHTDTPSHSRMVGTDFGFSTSLGRPMTYNAPDTAFGFSLNAVDVTPPPPTPTPPSSVPEPASWSLLLLGVGAIGAVTRKRKAAVTAVN